jgi:hypothetical protein
MASREPMTKPLGREERTLIRLATGHLFYTLLLAVFGLLLLGGTLTTDWSGPVRRTAWFGPFVMPELAVRIAAVVGFLVYAGLNFWAVKCLDDRKHYWYCFTAACLNCLFVPLGTAVGVHTLWALPRRGVRALFRPAEANYRTHRTSASRATDTRPPGQPTSSTSGTNTDAAADGIRPGN